MKNSQKSIYVIAIIAITIIIVNGIYSTRIMNGVSLKNNVLISLNTEDGHGVEINQDSKFASFVTGYVYKLQVSNFPNPDKSTISVAIPIKRLKPDTTYSCELRFNMQTNSPKPVTLKSNSSISVDQTSFETDINFKPITINNGSREYVINFSFETNDEGVGFAIFDFEVDKSIDTLDVDLSNVEFTNFKEITTNDNVDTESESETSLEIV